MADDSPALDVKSGYDLHAFGVKNAVGAAGRKP